MTDERYSDLREQIRRLETKVSGLEGRGDPCSNIAGSRHNSTADHPGAQTEVTDEPDEHRYPTQLTNAAVIPEVRKCDFMHFKNRFTGDDGCYAIDVLCGSSATLEQEIAEELRVRERYKDKVATTSTPSRSKAKKQKGSEPESANISHLKATDKRTAADDATDPWIHRVRLQSPALLKILSDVQGESWTTQPRTYSRPFASMVYFQPKMKERLQELESRWARHLDRGRSTTCTGSSTPYTPPPDGDGGDDGDGTHDPPPPTNDIALEAPIDDCPEALAAMRCYVSFVNTDILPQYTYYDNLTAADDPGVLFCDLHYLFRTGELIYRPHGQESGITAARDGREAKRAGKRLWRAYSLRSRDTRYRVTRPSDHREYDISGTGSSPDGVGDGYDVFLVGAFYLEYTGEEFVTVSMDFPIAPYKGLRRVRSLPVYPARFGPKDYDEYIAHSIAYGNKILQYIETKHAAYDGWSVTRTPKGDAASDMNGNELKHPEYIDSDVMIDFAEAFQACPRWNCKRTVIRPKTVELKAEMDDFAIMWWSDRRRTKQLGESGEVAFVRTGVSVWEHQKYVSEDPLLKAMAENSAKGHLTTKEYLREEDKVLIPYRVFGYVLRDRKFAQLDIEHISPVSGSTDALESLRIPQHVKDLVQGSVRGHLMQKQLERQYGQSRGGQDFIKGKGAGLFILLHGVPGVGKTATAEAIAQTNGKPLFKVTCGDLGLTPDQVETSLGGIFRLADTWDCILLMDEVDTFFSQRSKGDAAMTKNALVSVFLRILDYYTGILFMTTNRVGALDEAFRSRIHYNILYPSLSAIQTREIWQLNLRRLQAIDEEHRRHTGRPPMRIPVEEILAFAERQFASRDRQGATAGQWNGRQIRNAFQVARSLAYAETAVATAARGEGTNGGGLPAMVPSLHVRHFEIVEKLSQDFDEYMREVYGGSDTAELALEMETRADRFVGREWQGQGHVQISMNRAERERSSRNSGGGWDDLIVGGLSGTVSRGSQFWPRNGGISSGQQQASGPPMLSVPDPAHHHPNRRGVSPVRGEYDGAGRNQPLSPVPPHSPRYTTCRSPGRQRAVATDQDAEWGRRPRSESTTSPSFSHAVGALGRGTSEYMNEVSATEREGRREEIGGYGDVPNEYGKRERLNQHGW